ncbi:MAG: alpha/beta hydrolase, partial [Parabacteroides sp.]|nr:alpha/beta hydrolase [Parabacteroides sp.]
MKNTTKILAGVLGGGVAATLILSNIFYNIGLKRPTQKKHKKAERSNKELALQTKLDSYRQWFRDQNPEKITIESFDGLKLTGYYLPCENAKRTVICVHGYHGEGIRDFAFIGKFYYEYGSNVLVIDQRGHGESEGNYVDMGVKARFDCKQWTELINARTNGATPIYLDGVSMGAATVLMAGGLELPDTVHGIIADCGFSSPWDQVQYACRQVFHLPVFPTAYLLNLQCRLRAGYSLREASPAEALKNCKIPILFIHGEDDDYVPPTMSQINYDACAGEKQIEIVP